MSEINDFYPRLVVEGADDALAFYAKAFGAEVTERYTADGGRVQHAMLVVGPARFAVKDAGDGDPAPVRGRHAGDHGVVRRATRTPWRPACSTAGARVIFPVTDHEYGERAGRLADPWGHQWMLAKRL